DRCRFTRRHRPTASCSPAGKEELMRFMRVAAYDMGKGNFRELAGIAEEGILPLLRDAPGFVDYGLVDAGDNTVVEVSIWETRQDARKPTRAAAKWIKDHVADRIRLVRTHVGDLALSRSGHIRTLGDALRARAV